MATTAVALMANEKKSAESGEDPCISVPAPRSGERPAAYADRLGEWCVSFKSEEDRKKQGLYLTPLPVADFMAGRIQAKGAELRALDPAAGAGVLCCAAVEALAKRRQPPRTIRLCAFEVDAELVTALRSVLAYLQEWCGAKYGIRLETSIEATDFVAVHAGILQPDADLLSDEPGEQDYDVVIANPPYFKINKSDPRAAAAASVVYGQPNIYALFMAIGAALLKPGGDFVFITPRSFASGAYFRRFRTAFFDMIRLRFIHVFASRRAAFRRDKILQENVILCGIRQDRERRNEMRETLKISSSGGVDDLEAPEFQTMPMKAALDLNTANRILRLPLSENDSKTLTLVDGWPSTLHSLGLDISTGPVVPFRAKELIVKDGCVPDTHVPLLWMNHIHSMRVTWPLARHKPEYIMRTGAKPLLVPNRNYVLMRRFSAKEETRRLTAAPYIMQDFPTPEIGLENHLNYIYRPGGDLSEDEAWGLAVLYNSRLMDVYFRCVNGNTQVSAAELRAMPLPAYDDIVALGCQARRSRPVAEKLDELVMRQVGHTPEEIALG